MPRSAGTVVENNFVKGLITEATGLNFPENGCVATDNCKFTLTGKVRRRLGIDLESSAIAEVYSYTDGVLVEYLWRAAALTGTFVFLVLQRGSNLSIYNLTANNALSTGLVYTLDLSIFTVPYANPADLKTKPCMFFAGGGRLNIVHPTMDPILLDYDDNTQTFLGTTVTLKIRDFEGADDGLDVDEQPSTLSPEHHYNLMNQGWYDDVRTGDVTSV